MDIVTKGHLISSTYTRKLNSTGSKLGALQETTYYLKHECEPEEMMPHLYVDAAYLILLHCGMKETTLRSV